MKKTRTDEPTVEKCIIPECTRPQYGRGLCSACHKTALRAIADKIVTEEKLIEQGLLLPSNRPRSVFSKRLDALVKACS